jgi:MFS family permease
VIIWMAYITDATSLAVALTLTRGLGQSMLSVLSIALVARWFQRRLGLAMGVYSVLMGLMMGTAMGLVGNEVISDGWRRAWWDQGRVLLYIIAPLLWIFARSSPAPGGAEFQPIAAANKPDSGIAWTDALLTPCFWVFAIAISFFGLLSSGISLFQGYVLKERGFGEDVLQIIMTVGPLIGMATNLGCGILSHWLPLPRLLAGAMLVLAASLACFPFITEFWQICIYTVTYGIAGGMITVLFFAVWGKAFPGPDLGRIQAIAQMLTVLASAAGPLVVEYSKASTGSYLQAFLMAAIVSAALGIAAWFTPLPQARAAEVFVSPALD